MKIITLILKILVLIILFHKFSYANNIGKETGLDLPRYISLKSNDANIRVGPSKNYPISLKYIVKNFPLKITEEYDDWRKVIDFENNTGWIHKSLIKGERNGIIISNNKEKVNVYNTINGKKIGEISNGLIIHLSKCKVNWCLIVKDDYRGWVDKKYIWGVKEKEKFNIGIFQIFTDYYFKSTNFLIKILL